MFLFFTQSECIWIRISILMHLGIALINFSGKKVTAPKSEGACIPMTKETGHQIRKLVLKASEACWLECWSYEIERGLFRNILENLWFCTRQVSHIYLIIPNISTVYLNCTKLFVCCMGTGISYRLDNVTLGLALVPFCYPRIFHPPPQENTCNSRSS